MLEHFFQPSSIAVVGASRTPGKVGHDTLKNLIDAGFEGPIYPVNPKADEVLGLKCYADLKAIGKGIDLAVIAIPSKFVPDVIGQCAAVGCSSVIVISAGFQEAGEEGARLQAELRRRCAEHGVRCIGPNCLGVISPSTGLNASFSATMPPAGNVSFFSQSGAVGTAVLDVFAGENVGISRFVSYGNKADVDESDLIKALGEDESTEVILGYVESISDGAKFMSAAGRVTKKKPVVVLKSGRTAAGARAASSHTGSLAGADVAYEAAFAQCGVVRARNVTTFFDFALGFSRQGPPKGNRVAIVTNAGGPGILTTDAIESCALTMAALAEKTESYLASRLPPAANIHNPIDVLGDAKAAMYRVAIEAAIGDENVDALLVILTPQTTTEVETTAEAIGELAAGTEKPVLACFMGSLSTGEGCEILDRMSVPNYIHPERAVTALDAMYRFRTWTEATPQEPPAFEFDEAAIEQVLGEAAERGMTTIGERHAGRLVEACGLPLPESVLAEGADAAVRAAAQIGYPVVMKVSSDDILHKSDAGGVKVGLADETQVRAAYDEIMEGARAYKADAAIDGVLVQQMVTGGTEVIVGMSRDPQFGPLVMFGLGGIYVELLKDVAFRVAPLTAEDAREMIDEIKGSDMLKGFRGREPGDLDALADCILRVSYLAARFPQLTECDLNPLLVFPRGQGVMALDARFALEGLSPRTNGSKHA